MSENILNLRYKDVISRLHRIKSSFEMNYNRICGYDVPVFLRKQVPIGNCGVSDGLSENKYIEIGIDGLRSFHFGLPTTSVSDEKFVQVLVSMFHENRHMLNCLNGYKKCRSDKDENLALSMSYLADQHNFYYYTGNHNYHKNLREIDAEHAGIIDAYDYLRVQFPDRLSYCKQLILDYVNHKRELVLDKKIDYFFDESCKEFQSISDINDVFNTLFADAMHKCRMYSLNRNCDDLAMKKFCQNGDWRKIFDKVLDAESPLEKDKMIGSVVLAVYPEYQIEIFDLKDIDFSPQVVFGCDFPYDEEIARVQQDVNGNDCGRLFDVRNNKSFSRVSSRTVPYQFEDIYAATVDDVPELQENTSKHGRPLPNIDCVDTDGHGGLGFDE